MWRAFERFAALDPEPARLERTEAAGNDHGARMKARVQRGAQQEGVILQHLQFGHFLAQVKLCIEGLGLLQQPIHQFLRAADRQRRNVVNRLLRVQLAALAAGMLERIDDVRVDAQQAELENLEQAAGAGADDDHIGLDCAVDGVLAGTVAQESSPLRMSTGDEHGAAAAVPDNSIREHRFGRRLGFYRPIDEND